LLVLFVPISFLGQNFESKQHIPSDIDQKKIEIIGGVTYVTQPVRPDSFDRWTGHAWRSSVGIYGTVNGPIDAGRNSIGTISRGWAIFNTSKIPQYSTIQSASLKAYCRDPVSDPSHRVQVKRFFDTPPWSLSSSEIYDAIGNESVIYANNWDAMTSTGYKEINYLTAGINDLQTDNNSGRRHGVSFMEIGENNPIGRFDGWNWGGKPEPILYVTFIANSDLSVSNFIFLPQTIQTGAHPDDVRFRLCNNGPVNLISPNTRVYADFYLSRNSTFGDADDRKIGDNGYDFTLSSGSCTDCILTPTGRSYITIPQDASGYYYVFVRVRHADPSILNDPDLNNNYTNRYPTVVDVEEMSSLLPESYSLSQNYPNPFNPSSTIKYALPYASHVNLSVFNTLGQRVALLVDGKQEAGYHEVTFEGSGLTSGVYFYRLQAHSINSQQANDYIETKKLILMK